MLIVLYINKLEKIAKNYKLDDLLKNITYNNNLTNIVVIFVFSFIL